MSPRWPRKAMDPDRFQMKDLKRRVAQIERDQKRLEGRITRRLDAHNGRLQTMVEALQAATKEVKKKG